MLAAYGLAAFQVRIDAVVIAAINRRRGRMRVDDAPSILPTAVPSLVTEPHRIGPPSPEATDRLIKAGNNDE